jgi:hypothetical protein
VRIEVDSNYDGSNYTGLSEVRFMGVPINIAADNTVTIGAYEYAGTTATYFNGQIDDVRIYDRGLSESEIMEIAQ